MFPHKVLHSLQVTAKCHMNIKALKCIFSIMGLLKIVICIRFIKPADRC